MKTLNALVNLKKELHAELIKNDDFKLYTKICGLIDELNYKPPVVVKAIIHKPVAKSSKNRKNSPLHMVPFKQRTDYLIKLIIEILAKQKRDLSMDELAKILNISYDVKIPKQKIWGYLSAPANKYKLNNLPFRFHAIDGSLKDIGDGKLVSFIRKL